MSFKFNRGVAGSSQWKMHCLVWRAAGFIHRMINPSRAALGLREIHLETSDPASSDRACQH